MQWYENGIGFGSEPDLGTQRFWPEFHQTHGVPCFSQGEFGRVRSRRGARTEPASPIRLDLQNSGASCYRSDTTGIVISLGLTPGSRKCMVLRHAPAGAANGSDSIDKFATLFPPFRTTRNIYRTEYLGLSRYMFRKRSRNPSSGLRAPSPTRRGGRGLINDYRLLPFLLTGEGGRRPDEGEFGGGECTVIEMNRNARHVRLDRPNSVAYHLTNGNREHLAQSPEAVLFNRKFKRSHW
jgi:hypothetical protein